MFDSNKSHKLFSSWSQKDMPQNEGVDTIGWAMWGDLSNANDKIKSKILQNLRHLSET